MSRMQDPIIIDPPDCDVEAIWREFVEFKHAHGGGEYEKTPPWLVAMCGSPLIVSCPCCVEMTWLLGHVQKCRECGFVYPTDWRDKFVAGQRHGLAMIVLNIRPENSYFCEQRNKHIWHAYYRWGFEHCREAAPKWGEAVGDWTQTYRPTGEKP